MLEIKEQFYQTLQQTDWMDNRTRENAIEKLKSMEFRIGYPDEILIDDLISKYYRDVLFLLLFYYLSLFIISFCKSLY